MTRRPANKQCLSSSLSSDAGPSQILPFLYVGCQEDAISKKTMQDLNITHVINVSTTGDRATFLNENDDEHFFRIPINDCLNAQLLPHLDQAYVFIEKARMDNGRIFIHCLAGISRSPALAIAYVMRYLHLSVDDAYRYVKQRRSQISPNFNFLGQLSEYERNLSIPSISTTAPLVKCVAIESPLQDRRRFIEVNGSSNTDYSIAPQTDRLSRPKLLFSPLSSVNNRSITLSSPKLNRPNNISLEHSTFGLINRNCGASKDKKQIDTVLKSTVSTEETDLINTCLQASMSSKSLDEWNTTPLFGSTSETTTPDVLGSVFELLAS